MKHLAFAIALLCSTPNWATNPTPTPTPPPIAPATATTSTTAWWRLGLRAMAPFIVFWGFYELCKMHEAAVAAEKAAKK